MTELPKILHVEDDLDIQAIALLSLETLGGFTIVQASSGQEALEKAPAFSPDLFLLDVVMSPMDGPELLQELRKLPQFTQTPVIFMTAKAQPEEVQQFVELGAIDIITKPFDPMTLADQIRAIWQNTR